MNRDQLLARYRRMKAGADPQRRAEDRFVPDDLPTPAEVAARRAACDACEHALRVGAALGCALCPACPKGKQRRVLFTLPKTAAGRALFWCPAGKWDAPTAAVPPAMAGARALRVGIIVSSRNEGPLVAATVDSFRSVAGLLVETFVVDDASTDSSCDRLPGHVIRREVQAGVAANWNDGARMALDFGADALVFADAHVRVSGTLLRAISEKALRGPAVICPATRSYSGIPIAGFGGRLAKKGLIWIQWSQVHPRAEWSQVTAPFGGLYCLSAETAEILSGPTGEIFDTTAGHYGYVEEMVGIKCHFLKVPVWVYSGDTHQHLFKVAGAGGGHGRERNLVRTAALYFSTEFFDEKFRALAERLLSPEEVAAIRAEAAGKCRRTWTIEDERAFYDAIPEG